MPLDADTIARLGRTRTIDLTTIGRRSGRLATIEIWWFHFEGRFIVTGPPDAGTGTPTFWPTGT